MDPPVPCKADWIPTVPWTKKHGRIGLRRIDLVKQVVVDGVAIREIGGNFQDKTLHYPTGLSPQSADLPGCVSVLEYRFD